MVAQHRESKYEAGSMKISFTDVMNDLDYYNIDFLMTLIAKLSLDIMAMKHKWLVWSLRGPML